MPHAELHKKKKARNYAVLAAVLCFVAILFVVSIIRMKGG
jgi:hypothetical protein